MRVIIAGSRNFKDYKMLRKVCLQKFRELRDIHNLDTSKENVTIVSGGADGADSLGETFAGEFGLNLVVMNADWNDITAEGAIVKENKYGKYNAKAGSDRNKKMAEYAKESKEAGVLIAFSKNNSSGTKNMISLAKEYGLIVFVVEV